MSVGQPSEDRLGGVGRIVGAQVHDQQGRVGRADQAGQPGLHDVGGDRRQVHDVNSRVVPEHHSGSRNPGRERVRRHVRLRIAQRGQQGAFAGVRRPDQDNLSSSFPRDPVRRSFFLTAGLVPFQFLLRPADLPLQFRLELFRPFVLGNNPEQLAKTFQSVVRVGRSVVFLLNLEIL